MSAVGWNPPSPRDGVLVDLSKMDEMAVVVNVVLMNAIEISFAKVARPKPAGSPLFFKILSRCRSIACATCDDRAGLC